MNFGAFAGGFSTGFDSGVRQAKTIRDVIKERKLEDLRTKGMEEASAARTAAVNGMITENPTEAAAKAAETAKPAPVVDNAIEPGNPAQVEVNAAKPQEPVSPDAGSVTATPRATTAQNTPAVNGLPTQTAPQTTPEQVPAQPPAKPAEANTPAQGKFMVGGKSYATREEAYKAADASAPSTMDFFMKNAVPKIQEQYLANGDIEKAKAWDEWSQQHKSQQAMKEWSSMYRAAQFGDFEKAADHAFNLYKQYDDGVTPVSKETVKDADGNVTGFNVRLKNDATGEIKSQFIDKKGLVEMGLSALAPNKMFEVAFKRQSDADTAAMNARIKANEKAQDFKMDMAKTEYKENRDDKRQTEKLDREDAREVKKGQQKLSEISLTKQLEAENMGAKERAKAETKIQLLTERGYTDEQITAMVPAIIGAGEHKKTTDPAERRALIASDMMKNDPKFSRSTKEQQNKAIDDMMSVIYGGEQTPAGKPAAKPPANGKPAAIADKPMAYDPKLPVKWNKATGKPYHYVDGQYIPINGEVPTQTAPAQAKPAAATGPAGGLPQQAPKPAPAAATTRASEAAGLEERYNALRQSLAAMRKTEPADSPLIKNAERQLSALEGKILGGR